MYTKESIETFLQNQGLHFDEEDAASYQEAEEILLLGADRSGMSGEELVVASEVFRLPSGGYLVVEG